jgi:YbbR domain-containing protein
MEMKTKMKSRIVKALFSAALAIGIWLYVVTVVSPNSDKHFYNIPVNDSSKVLLHQQELMIVDMETSKVSIHLEGNRVDLNKLSSDKIPVTLDVSKIYQAGIHEVPYDVNVPDGVTIREKSPETITVEVVPWTSTSVPVEVDYGDTAVKDGYIPYKESKELNITDVEIAGPTAVVNQIKMAKIQVDLTDRKDTINEFFTHTLCDENGAPVDAKNVTVNTESIKLTLPIMRLKELKLRVKVLPGGGATEENTAITVNPATVWVSGSETLLEKVEDLEIGPIDLGEILEDQTVTLPIKLREGLISEAGVTKATVEVKLPELATRTITVRNITAENKPAGMEIELLAKAMEIQVRGPKEKVESLDVQSLQIRVDFTDTELGAVQRKFELVGADADIGPVGPCLISANVTKSNS